MPVHLRLCKVQPLAANGEQVESLGQRGDARLRDALQVHAALLALAQRQCPIRRRWVEQIEALLVVYLNVREAHTIELGGVVLIDRAEEMA